MSKGDSNAVSGLFSEMTRWLSPFSKLKQAAIKQREANKACESYFETYYGAAGANTIDYAVDAYRESDNEDIEGLLDSHRLPYNFPPRDMQPPTGDSRFRSSLPTRFNMSSGIGVSQTPLQKQLNQMKQNLGHHLEMGDEENATFNLALRHVDSMEELASM